MGYKTTNHKGGRPKSNATILAQKMRLELVKRVKKEFKPLVDAQIDAAKGFYEKRVVKLPGGHTIDKYYLIKPDVSAAKNLIDQAIGKPKDSIELSGEVKTITELVASLDKQ